jgi:predicted DNA-binding antitoxin AbrB/MazE fold protein
MLVLRAVYRDGKFHPFETVDLPDGEVVQIQIVEKDTSLQELIGDMLSHFDSDESDLDEEAILQSLDQALAGKRPLSEIILEERREGR